MDYRESVGPETGHDFAAECVREARLVRENETKQDREDAEAWWELSDTTGWTA
jgi:hypothetical protein